jgi:predicted ArsR family transcriptional regulator
LGIVNITSPKGESIVENLPPPDGLLSLDEYLAMQRTIGNETRYRVLVELLGDEEPSASELAESLDEPSNNLHHHLDKLVDVGLVANRKRKERGADGLYSYYVATSMGEAIMNHGVAELIRREWEFLERYA